MPSNYPVLFPYDGDNPYALRGEFAAPPSFAINGLSTNKRIKRIKPPFLRLIRFFVRVM